MLSLKAGDRIDCLVKSNNIVTSGNEHDEVRTFEIVAVDDKGYYIFVPCFIYINGSSILDTTKARRLGIDPLFVDEKISYIVESFVFKISQKLDGMKCRRCKDFFIMAEPNTPEGEFWCRSCRKNPYR